MIIMKSKKYSQTRNELESQLNALIHNFAYDKGLECFFIVDSKNIQEGISSISERIADLLENTFLIKHQIGSRKSFNYILAQVPDKKVVKK